MASSCRAEIAGKVSAYAALARGDRNAALSGCLERHRPDRGHRVGPHSSGSVRDGMRAAGYRLFRRRTSASPSHVGDAVRPDGDRGDGLDVSRVCRGGDICDAGTAVLEPRRSAASRQRHVGRCERVLPMGGRTAADRSRMGACGARRTRGRNLRVGQRSAHHRRAAGGERRR